MSNKFHSLTISFLAAAFIFGCSSPHCDDTPTPAPEVVSPQNFTDISNATFPTLLGVDFQDSLNGYISGVNGFVRKTTTGGATWTDVNIANTGDVYGIYFLNNNEGFAGTYSNELFKTTDAGTTWTKLTTPNSVDNHTNFHFFDASNGIAGGGTPTRAGTIIKTTDGGTTWTEVPVTGMSTIYDIEFINNTTGYLCGYDNNIFKTTDGGATWVNQPVTISTPANNTILLAEIEFVNSTVGYCVGYSINYDKNFIFKTTNGGATWNQLPSPAQTAATADVYTSFFAINANEIYIVGGNVANNTSTLLKSTDGGISWSNIPMNTSRLYAATYLQNTSYIVGLDGTIIKSRN